MNISNVNAILNTDATGDYCAKVELVGGIHYFITLSQDDGGISVSQLPDVTSLFDDIESCYNNLKNSAEMGSMPDKYIMVDALHTMSVSVVSTSFWG